MRVLGAFLLLFTLAAPARSQPADCAPDPNAPPPASVPLELNLSGLPGVPSGVGGQAFVAAPLSNGGMTCTDRRPPPRDILRGEPMTPSGDLLHGAKGDLLRGPSQ